MKRSQLYYVFVLIFCQVLASSFASESQDANIEPSSTLASTEGLVSSIIEGTVSAVTGECIHSHTDIHLPGPEPLVLHRFYSSKDTSTNFFKQGWSFNEENLLLLYDGETKNEHRRFQALVTAASGAKLAYKKRLNLKRSKEWQEFHLEDLKGFTNCGGGRISASTNLKNNTFLYNKYKEIAVLHSLDGTKRTFKTKLDYDPVILGLTTELKANKTLKKYKYNYTSVKSEVFKKVSIHNEKENLCYSFIEFDKEEDSRFFTIKAKTSGGYSVKYGFQRYKYDQADGKNKTIRRYFLESVENPKAPNIAYQYIKTLAEPYHRLLSEIRLPDNRFKQIEYYSYGKHDFGNGISVTVPYYNKDFRLDRVSCLKAPVGHDATPVMTHCFVYHTYDPISYKFTGNCKDTGETEVFDAHFHRQVYHYGREDRLIRKERFRGNHPTNYRLYAFDEYAWGEKDSDVEGNLMGTWHVQAEPQRVLKARFFTYDDRGNIIVDRQYGNVTGKPSPEILIHDYKLIETGAECYTKTYSYSQDEYNLMLSESESNGKVTRYGYVPNTNALAIKFVTKDFYQIYEREFNAYDSNLFLIRRVVDDGNTEDGNNLQGVTCRKITEYVPTSQAPFGLPAQIIEKYLDLNTGQERLLHKTVCEYNRDGLVTVQHHYDGDGNLRYSLSWGYDAHNNCILEMNALGQNIERRFDANDNKIYECGPNPGFYTLYTYDFSNRLIKEEQVHQDGSHLAIHYRYDYLGNLVSEVDPYGNEVRHEYDEFNRRIATYYPQINSGFGGAQAVERFSYDTLGNQTAKANSKCATTYATYNIHGKVLQTFHPDGTVESNEYTLDGQLARTTDRIGCSTVYQRDCFGRVLKEEIVAASGETLASKQFYYNGQQLVGILDEMGLYTGMIYDGAGRLIEEGNHTNRTTYTYDSLGRPYQTFRWFGATYQETRLEYDVLDRVLSEKIFDEKGTLKSHKAYAYDAAGNKTAVMDGHSLTLTLYNSKSEPIQITDSEGNVTHIQYDTTFLNELGQRVQKITTTDPSGCRTEDIKDVFGRTRIMQKFDPQGGLLMQVDTYYDFEGNVLSTRQDKVIDGRVVDANSQSYEYDCVNNLIRQIDAVGTPEQKITQYAYNELGQKCVTVKPDGTQLHAAYDGKGRVKLLHALDESFFYAYEYNAKDQITKVTELLSKEEVLRTYDAVGRICVERLANGLEMRYTHDPLNRVTQVTLPDGSQINYYYDALHLKEVKRGEYIHRYEYDLNSNVIKSHFPKSAGTTLNEYDRLNRLKTVIHPAYNQALIYDSVGNLVKQYVQDSIGPHHQDYTYDHLNQLTAEIGLEDHTYQYDSLNNRIGRDHVYCPNNHLNQVLSQGETKYTYDLNGNLKVRQTPTSLFTYTYDALDRLIAVNVDGKTYQYRYDCFNRRISKDQTLYFHVEDNEIGAYENGCIQQLRVLGVGFGAEIGAAVLLELEQETYFPIHNHSGHIIALLQANGQIKEVYRYTAFGNQKLPVSNLNPWRFASKRFDPETGYSYFGRRYYDPDLGRWTTMDPAEELDGPNLYSYLHNNPLTSFDLYGLFAQAYDPGFDPTVDLIKLDLPEIPPKFERELAERPFKYYDFEKKFSVKSAVYHLGRPELPGGNLFINYINGMGYSLEEAGQVARMLSDMSGGYNVYLNYNASHGTPHDTFECLLNMMNVCTNPAGNLRKTLYYFKSIAPDFKAILTYHSQGGLHTENVLRALPTYFREHISAVGIASAGYVPKKCCRESVHYRAGIIHDFVPYLNVLGALTSKNVRTLKSHPDAPWFDHTVVSPTYQEPLNQRFTNFVNTGGIWTPN